MTFDDFKGMAEALGVPFAFGAFVFWVLARNGMLKVIMRDHSSDALDKFEKRLKEVEAGLAETQTSVAVLNDRWHRRDS